MRPDRSSDASGPLFPAFWHGGFESAQHRNARGVRLDMLAATQHDRRAALDYALLRRRGLGAARDGLRWPRSDRRGTLDMTDATSLARAAARQRVTVVWTLCHFGWPSDLHPLRPAFAARFARWCAAVARRFRQELDEPRIYIPINEISFLTWALGAGVIRPRIRDGEAAKRALVRAAIAGMDALWSEDPQARVVHCDPVIHVIAPEGRPGLADAAARQHASQFEAWDMLAGRAAPELGGHPRYLDIIGVNFYHSNQWVFPDERVRWEDHPRDPRWRPFHQILAEVYARYQRPIYVSETGHFGGGRGPWISEIAEELRTAMARGVPLEGVCVYPILDRPDWDVPTHWHRSGLWDLIPDEKGTLRRRLNRPYAAALTRAMQRLPPSLRTGTAGTPPPHRGGASRKARLETARHRPAD